MNAKDSRDQPQVDALKVIAFCNLHCILQCTRIGCALHFALALPKYRFLRMV